MTDHDLIRSPRAASGNRGQDVVGAAAGGRVVELAGNSGYVAAEYANYERNYKLIGWHAGVLVTVET